MQKRKLFRPFPPLVHCLWPLSPYVPPQRGPESKRDFLSKPPVGVSFKIPCMFACRSGVERDSLFPRFQTADSCRGSMSFSHLGLSEKVLAAVAATGYTTPTPLQEQAIPHR